MNRKHTAITTRYTAAKFVMTVNPQTGECYLPHTTAYGDPCVKQFCNINEAGAWIRERGAMGAFVFENGVRIGRQVLLFFFYTTYWNDGFIERRSTGIANRIDAENDDGDGNWKTLTPAY